MFNKHTNSKCRNIHLNINGGGTTIKHKLSNILNVSVNEVQNNSIVLSEHGDILGTGECGTGNSWTVYSDGLLYIYGTGTLVHGDWNTYKDYITDVYIEDGVDINDIAVLQYRDFVKTGSYSSELESLRLPEGLVRIISSGNRISPKCKHLYLPSTFNQEMHGNCVLASQYNMYIHVDESNQNYCDIDGVLYSKDKKRLCYYTLSDAEYTIPEGTEYMNDAFYDNAYIKTINIPKSLKYIEDYNYEPEYNWSTNECYIDHFDMNTDRNRYYNWCIGMSTRYTPIAAINVNAENKYFCSVDGVLYNKDMTELIYYPKWKSGEYFTVPESVIVICAGAFDYVQYLKHLELNDGIEIIGRNAICDSRVEELEVPSTVKKFGSGAIAGSSLKKVRILGPIEEGTAIIQCTNLKSLGGLGSGCDIEIYGTETIFYLMFGFSKGLNTAHIPEGVKNIEGSVFYDCNDLDSITIPSTTSSISSTAFSRCTSLADIYIDKYAFELTGAPWGAENATIHYNIFNVNGSDKDRLTIQTTNTIYTGNDTVKPTITVKAQ